MRSAIVEYSMILISGIKESKRIKKGKEKNQNLPKEVADKVARLKAMSEKGNTDATYQLGIMYLDAEEVGYDPQLGKKYLEMAAKKNDFDANYALALFYKGHWSYQHNDDLKSYMQYLAAKNCQPDNPNRMAEVLRALDNDFIIDTSSRKKGLQAFFKNDIPIR